MPEGSAPRVSEGVDLRKKTQRERTPVTSDQEKVRQAELLREQMQHAATFALLHARDYRGYSQDAYLDTPDTSEFTPENSTTNAIDRAQSLPERRAGELLASHEFQACTRELQTAMQRAMNEAYASLETNARNRQDLDESGRPFPHNLPGFNAIMRRTMLLGSMPVLVQMVERWKQHNKRHDAADEQVPAQVSTMIDQYARRVTDGLLFGRNREPAAELARTVAMAGTERHGVTVGREITSAAATYVNNLETRQPSGLSHRGGTDPLVHLDPQKWRELVLMTAPMVAEMRGYNGAPAELSPQDRQSLDLPHPREAGYAYLVDPRQLVATEAYVAGQRRGAADEAAAKARLEALASKQQEYAALERRKTEVADRLRTLSFDTVEERNARYAQQRFEEYGKESNSDERAIEQQQRAVRAIELRQQAALREYHNAIPGLPSRARARAEYQRAEQDLLEAQNKLIEMQEKLNREDDFVKKLDALSVGERAAATRRVEQQIYGRTQEQLAGQRSLRSDAEHDEEQSLRKFLAKRANRVG